VDGWGARGWKVIVVAAAMMVAATAAHAGRGSVVTRAVDAGSIASIERANVSTEELQSDGASSQAVLSASGRFVAFVSAASNLTPGDTNGMSDVFVRDLQTGVTSRESVATDGTQSDGPSKKPSIGSDGRIVTFPSVADNLVPDDWNAWQDVFVRDRATGTTRRLSMGVNGEANGDSLASLVSADGSTIAYSSNATNIVRGDRNRTLDVFLAGVDGTATRRISVGAFGESRERSEASSIDAHGRIVAFRSYAPDLVLGDANGFADVFVHDRDSDTVERVNVPTAGGEADGVTFRGMVSGNGRYVGFRSRANNLVAHDTNDALDVFVHDRATGRTRRVSVASDGSQADGSGFARPARASAFMSRPFLSANGRFAAFSSRATNLVRDDRNGKADVFVHDRLTGRTIRVSLTADGTEADEDSFVAGISADGQVVAFTSLADNLVHGDTNGRRDVFVVWLKPLLR
jgi:Tol biopolymer transport system component